MFEDFLRSLGLNVEQALQFSIAIPFVLFVVSILVFFSAIRRQKSEERKQSMLSRIVKQSRSRTTALTPEEIAARLNPRAAEAAKKSAAVKMAELALKLVNFDREETEKKLVQAGDRDPRAISRYILQRGAGMALAPLLFWSVLPMLGIEGIFRLVISLGGILAGGIFVDAQLDRKLAARKSALSNQMPVFLDILVIYLEAGQAIDQAFVKAASALSVSFPDISDEVAHLRKELDMSVDRERTLRDFATRVGTDTAKTFVSIIIQSERRGSAVSSSMRVLAKEARKEVLIGIEQKAQKLPTLMQLPMFVFILPAIFLAVISPAVIQIMDTLSDGLF